MTPELNASAALSFGDEFRHAIGCSANNEKFIHRIAHRLSVLGCLFGKVQTAHLNRFGLRVLAAARQWHDDSDSCEPGQGHSQIKFWSDSCGV